MDDVFQLKQRLAAAGIREEVKLRWRKQPDGQIFHREEDTAPPGVPEEDCDSLTGVKWYK